MSKEPDHPKGTDRRDFLKRSAVVGLGLGVAAYFPPLPSAVGRAVSEQGRLVASRDSELASMFKDPPFAAKPWVYWWWLNSNVSREGIRRDLEAMQEVGIGGALVFDAGNLTEWGRVQLHETPAGPTFMSEEWQDLFAYAVETADRLGLEISLSIVSGWDDGGPWVPPEMAAKKIAWSEEVVEGPARLEKQLALPDEVFESPDTSGPYFKEISVLAVKVNPSSPPASPIENLDLKAVRKIAWAPVAPKENTFGWELYLDDAPENTGYDAKLEDVIDVTDHVDDSGRISWEVPEGRYAVLRFGYTATGARVSLASPGFDGLVIDYISAEAMDLQFDHTVGKLLEKVRPHAGKTFKYVHDDSWELGAVNWTPGFIEAFEQSNGYSPISYLPVIAGKVIESGEVSNRFLYDYRRTIADLIAEKHYNRFRTLAHRNDLGIHPESGGPIDALKNLGRNDIPMGEFWITSQETSPLFQMDKRRKWIKQTASAAHTYGKTLIQAEGPSSQFQWEKNPWELKPEIDHAFLEGMNRMMFHTFTHSPESAGKPGHEYMAGTHFNPNITWWEQAPAYVDYISRSQVLLQQGKFVADVCYYYNDTFPRRLPVERMQADSELATGYDYDVVNTEVILERMTVKDGKIYLPDGVSYEILVLPDRKEIPLGVLEKLERMVKQGATIVGPRPHSIPGLKDYEQADERVAAVASRMWRNIDGEGDVKNAYGEGNVVWGKRLPDILSDRGVAPDFSYRSAPQDVLVDYNHRSTDEADIYLIANQSDQQAEILASFRVQGKVPELWDPVNGEMIPQSIYAVEDGHTNVPVHLDAHDSLFMVFRRNTGDDNHIRSIAFKDQEIFPSNLEDANLLPRSAEEGKLQFHSAGTYRFTDNEGKQVEIDIDGGPSEKQLEGKWVVKFSPEWGGPESTEFTELISWTEHDKPGIKYYSGAASYHKTFDVRPDQVGEAHNVELNLGAVYSLAEVIVNERELGVVWTKPFSIDITEHVQAGENTLEIKVVNLWPNRIAGDQLLPEGERFTQTNVTMFTKDYPLLKSGLLGPVSLSFYPVREAGSLARAEAERE